MKKSLCALFCFTLLCLLIPAALSEEIGISFESASVTYESGSSVVLGVTASAAPESDLTVHIDDSRKNAYTILIPAGQLRGELLVSSPISATGKTTNYTIRKDAAYKRTGKYECTVTARAVTVYTFAAPVYQTYTGRDLTFKVRIANGDRLPSNTTVTLRDEEGNILETIHHSPSRQAYNFTYAADDSWRPGKRLSVWVEGRELPDSTALMAVGVTGSKSIYGVRREDNKIAFTMDCGSGCENLPAILDILDGYGLKITFFMTGQFVQSNPDMVQEVAARGHEIGNHSWSHPSFYDLSGEQMLSQLQRTNDLIASLTGQVPTLFRPPKGDCNSKIRAIVNAAGFEVIRWTHESYDARKEASAERSLKFSTKDITGGSIILTHIDADCTLAVLCDIFTWYADNGFEVVPVSKVLLQGNTATDENGLQYLID